MRISLAIALAGASAGYGDNTRAEVDLSTKGTCRTSCVAKSARLTNLKARRSR